MCAVYGWGYPVVADGFVTFTCIILHPLHVVWVLVKYGNLTASTTCKEAGVKVDGATIMNKNICIVANALPIIGACGNVFLVEVFAAIKLPAAHHNNRAVEVAMENPPGHDRPTPHNVTRVRTSGHVSIGVDMDQRLVLVAVVIAREASAGGSVDIRRCRAPRGDAVCSATQSG